MSRLTFDSAMLVKLRGFSEPVGLCDEQGRVVGSRVANRKHKGSGGVLVSSWRMMKG
jgi:hypothetical protein